MHSQYTQRWEKWDENIKQLTDISGPLINGTTFTIEQINGAKFSFTLSNVVLHKSIQFTGQSHAGTIKARGIINIEPMMDNFTTRITYSFELFGTLGFIIAAFFRKEDVVSGTERGLANMVKLCEEVQRLQHVIMN